MQGGAPQLPFSSVSLAMTQQMECAKVLFAQPRPPRAIGRRPEIARQAADEAFTAIVDLDEFSPTLIAAFRFPPSASMRWIVAGRPVGGTSASASLASASPNAPRAVAKLDTSAIS